MKIYTRRGDGGETQLLTGRRVPKNDRFIEALGELDEAISVLGLVRSKLEENRFSAETKTIEAIQRIFFFLGTIVASEGRMAKEWQESLILELETEIDQKTKDLAELKDFILPGSDQLSATIHYARSVVRRAERVLVSLFMMASPVQPALAYVNRVSDYLFVLARWVSRRLKKPEIPVHPDSLLF